MGASSRATRSCSPVVGYRTTNCRAALAWKWIPRSRGRSSTHPSARRAMTCSRSATSSTRLPLPIGARSTAPRRPRRSSGRQRGGLAAGGAKLADAQGLGPCSARSVGSSPSARTCGTRGRISVKIDIQYSPGANDWPALRDAVLQAEADGYDTTWVFDHFDGEMVQGDRPMLECFTLLGALAAATTTIGLGTLVANVANRHPAVLAAAASSVQRISDGRFTLGLGAGTSPESKWSGEHVARGIALQHDITDRHEAVVEQIRAVRDLP